MMEKDLNPEDIAKILETIWNENKPEREIILWSFCTSKEDLVERSGLALNVCGDPSCTACNMFDQALKEVAAEEIKKLNETQHD